MREWRTHDKGDWGPGPWQDEPDKAQWVDEDTGMDCLLVRNRSGALCGYVAVPEGHPLYRVGYNDCTKGDECDEDGCWDHSPDGMVEVHGGLTFSDSCHEPSEEEWLQVEQNAESPKLLAEVERYPNGDAARRLESLREQAGLTLEDWREYQQARRICHVPEPGRPDDVWWFGFDCAHAWDFSPGMAAYWRRTGRPEFAHRGYDEVYRTAEYVKAECGRLAAQLKQLS